MIIAFEGPDKAGKSTSADTLSSIGESVYNLEEDGYDYLQKALEGTTTVETVDRVSWITHMVYRLALPHFVWYNHTEGYPVFAMPDTHLVFKTHDVTFSYLNKVPADVLYTSQESKDINKFYRIYAGQLMRMNEMLDFSLFKSITLVEVKNDGERYSQAVTSVSSKKFSAQGKNTIHIDSDLRLLKLLQEIDQA